MNLKNRIIALATATAIAVPAIALAKHNMKPRKDNVPMAFFAAKITAGGGARFATSATEEPAGSPRPRRPEPSETSERENHRRPG